MKYWVFEEGQLTRALMDWRPPGGDDALINHEQRQLVTEFLNSEAAARNKMIMITKPFREIALDPADVKAPKRDTADPAPPATS